MLCHPNAGRYAGFLFSELTSAGDDEALGGAAYAAFHGALDAMRSAVLSPDEVSSPAQLVHVFDSTITAAGQYLRKFELLVPAESRETV